MENNVNESTPRTQQAALALSPQRLSLDSEEPSPLSQGCLTSPPPPPWLLGKASSVTVSPHRTDSGPEGKP